MSSHIDGIYSGQITGTHGIGFAMFVLLRGVITGVDTAGTKFDGTYRLSGQTYDGEVDVWVPPNTELIQGTRAGPHGLQYKVPVSLSAKADRQTFLQIQTPLGPINMNLNRLRDL